MKRQEIEAVRDMASKYQHCTMIEVAPSVVHQLCSIALAALQPITTISGQLSIGDKVQADAPSKPFDGMKGVIEYFHFHSSDCWVSFEHDAQNLKRIPSNQLIKI